jgi:hypothetical protein
MYAGGGVLGAIAQLCTMHAIVHVTVLYVHFWTPNISGPPTFLDPQHFLLSCATHAVMRLGVNYPYVILQCQAVFSTVTGAENYLVYSPSCLRPKQDHAGHALMQWLAAIITPCAVAIISMLLWTLR